MVRSYRNISKADDLTGNMVIIFVIILALRGLLTAKMMACPSITYTAPADKTTEGNPKYLLVCINSEPKKSDRRNMIRSTWGNEKEFGKHGLRVLFFVGKLRDDNLKRDILAENATYGDIRELEAEEGYRNLTSKTLAMMEFASSHHLLRPGSPENSGYLFYLKVDDDFLVNTYFLLQRIHNMMAEGDHSDVIYCYSWRAPPVYREGKAAIPEELYPQKYYPGFCSGGAYVLSHDVARELLKVSPVIDKFPLEDVHITGFLRTLVDIPVRYGNPAFLLYGDNHDSEVMGSLWYTYLFIHLHDPSVLSKNWDSMTNAAKYCEHPLVLWFLHCVSPSHRVIVDMNSII